MNSYPDGKMQLIDLVDTKDTDAVVVEIKMILSKIFDEIDTKLFEKVFFDIVDLFKGNYHGYQKCSTEYHDLQHTLDTVLAMARLIHGYTVKSNCLMENNVLIGLISALMHDTGYITHIGDNKGTGAKYTLTHITRSIEFAEEYFRKRNFSQADFNFCRNCISCTNTNTDPAIINFSSQEEKMLGKMLGIADLLGQMANRSYLEKLFLLYIEFEEGEVQGFENEFDLLQKTAGFFKFTDKRFAEKLGNLNRYMIYHFIERWNINEDLYLKAIEKNAQYLQHILSKNNKESIHLELRRDGILDNLRKRGLFPRKA